MLTIVATQIYPTSANLRNSLSPNLLVFDMGEVIRIISPIRFRLNIINLEVWKRSGQGYLSCLKEGWGLQWIWYLEVNERLDETRPSGLTQVALPKVINTSPKSSFPGWFFEAILCSTKSPRHYQCQEQRHKRYCWVLSIRYSTNTPRDCNKSSCLLRRNSSRDKGCS